MEDTAILIEQVYAAFNTRDIDAAVALMTDDVHWPKASEGGSIVGKDEIRAYWTRQWGEFDPHVRPLSLEKNADGTVRVSVHQVVMSLRGDVLSESDVVHVYTVRDGRIAAMNLGDVENASAAFAHSHTSDR